MVGFTAPEPAAETAGSTWKMHTASSPSPPPQAHAKLHRFRAVQYNNLVFCLSAQGSILKQTKTTGIAGIIERPSLATQSQLRVAHWFFSVSPACSIKPRRLSLSLFQKSETSLKHWALNETMGSGCVS